MGTTRLPVTTNALPGHRFDAWISGSLALFTFGQFAFLMAHDAIPEDVVFQASLLTGLVSLLLAQAWRMRRMLPAHTDMLLLMLAWGGFGMLWGWQLDGAMQAMPPDSGSAEMRASAVMPEAHVQHRQPGSDETHVHPSASHTHPGHGDMVYSGWFRWLNAMNGLMLLFAFPPSFVWARCLQPYRLFPWRLSWVLTLDAVGMVLGMMAGGRALGHPLGALTGAPIAAHHLAMLVGMLAGMYVTMLLRRWLAPLPGPVASPRR